MLEARLANSVAAGYSGELKLKCQGQGGLHLVFAKGRLAGAESFAGSQGVTASFPNHTFLHLLFGFRTAQEIHHLYQDCGLGGPETQLLMKILFPKLPSNVWVFG